MNQEQNTNTNGETIPAPDTDWFLQFLVNLVNKYGLKFGITINIGGFLVSGNLASGKEYFEGFAKVFSSAWPDEKSAELVRDSIEKFGEEIYKERNEDDSQVPLLHYIHLENAKFFSTSGKSVPSYRGVWWRGRISEVQGFVPGSLNISEKD